MNVNLAFTHHKLLCEATSSSKSGPNVCIASTTKRLWIIRLVEVSYGLFVKFAFTPVTCNSATLCPARKEISAISSLINVSIFSGCQYSKERATPVTRWNLELLLRILMTTNECIVYFVLAINKLFDLQHCIFVTENLKGACARTSALNI